MELRIEIEIFLQNGNNTAPVFRIGPIGSQMSRGNSSVTNQWAFTILETKNFMYNFLNFNIAKIPLCILLKFVQPALIITSNYFG